MIIGTSHLKVFFPHCIQLIFTEFPQESPLHELWEYVNATFQSSIFINGIC